jgi:hypothetical protein
MSMIKRALIQFNSGEKHWCIGRVVNGQTVRWKNNADLISHLKFIQSKGYEMEVLRIEYDG